VSHGAWGGYLYLTKSKLAYKKALSSKYLIIPLNEIVSYEAEHDSLYITTKSKRYRFYRVWNINEWMSKLSETTSLKKPEVIQPVALPEVKRIPEKAPVYIGRGLAIFGLVIILISSFMPWITTIPIPFLGTISASILDFMPKSLSTEGFNAFLTLLISGSEIAVEDAILGLFFASSIAFIIAIIAGIFSAFKTSVNSMEISGWFGIMACLFVIILSTSYIVELEVLGTKTRIYPLHPDIGAYACLIGGILMICAGYVAKREKRKATSF
jgi:hypothetical protein